MSKPALNELHREIIFNLTQKEFLKNIDISEEKIQSYLINKNFLKNLSTFMNKKTVTCKNILNLSADILNNQQIEPPEDWLGYIFQYVLNKSFPEAVTIKLNPAYEVSVIIYLEILRTILKYSHKNNMGSIPKLEFLTEEEIEDLPNKQEYMTFLDVFDKNHVYELMMLDGEVNGYNTLNHVSAVHYLATHVARQIKKAGVQVNLGIVSGSAAGHDIGKYGCKGLEKRRVAYLHYYYTDQWFIKYNMPGIGLIAANHSTWDLELENLSLESLLLIYADFRVKNKKTDKGEEMHIFSLTESFDIILNKLDNVDEAKEKRYIRVYSKLKDFEDYLVSKGINTDLSSQEPVFVKPVDFALIDGYEVVNNFKHKAFEHNIPLMSKLNNEVTFTGMIESARSETDWKNIRAYLNILEEYSIYLSQKEKLFALSFLYELLVHREGDIRKLAAILMGKIIVHYDLEYTKEIPEDVKIKQIDENAGLSLWDKYLGLFLSPGYKVTDKQKEWIGYSLRVFVDSVINSPKNLSKKEYLEVYLKHLHGDINDETAKFNSLNSLLSIPLELYNEDQLTYVLKFSVKYIKEPSYSISLMAGQFILKAVKQIKVKGECLGEILDLITELSPDEGLCMNYLKYKTAECLNAPNSLLKKYSSLLSGNWYKTSDIFLNNLKAATPWNVKTVSIDYIMENLSQRNEVALLQTATHLANLVKVSAMESVRNKAGNSLVQLGPMFTIDQRNEIAFELIKGLEIDEMQYAKYIPEYLGRFVMLLSPKELDEFITDLKNIYNNSSERSSALVIHTFGVMVQYYPEYKERFGEDKSILDRRLIRMLGIILGGLANFNTQVKQETFLVIGQYIFGSKILNLEQKYKVFSLIYKKLLTLISEKELSELFFFNNSASFNHIYRFISDYEFFYGKFDIKENKSIAFFPGTFDPFSLSHKGIVKEIRNLGYDVYLAVDEFSWSKKVQPRMIRRQIINMSIADELGVFLFSDDIPVNLANNEDLRVLKSLFPNKDIYMVVGSDVIINATAYKNKPAKNSIHYFNHIVFKRAKDILNQEAVKKAEEAKGRIKGTLVELKLPVYLEDISSSQIRENIDNNRDISNLIDPMAQNFIYDRNLYIREPLNKSVLKTKPFAIEIVEEISKRVIDEIGYYIFNDSELNEKIGETLNSKDIKLLIIRDAKYLNILGFSAFHKISTSDVYSEFKSSYIANYVREKTSGRIIVVDGIFAAPSRAYDSMEQILVTETLSHCIKNDFTYVLYNNTLSDSDSLELLKTLNLQGFIKICDEGTQKTVYGVDMKFPICLTLNLESFLKEPLNENQYVHQAISYARKRLQKAMTELYHGSLVLSIDNDMINQILINKICSMNKVPNEPQEPRVLGENMVVPFGNVLKGMVVPNTVTKSLHTEKVYSFDAAKFKIMEYPFYSPIENQVRTIESFEKPVILVDDVLHKGYRIKEIDPILKRHNINVKKIIVGIMSGRGKDLMDIQGREADCAYYIPNLRLWFNENLMYPFLGGDGIWIENENITNLIPSINLILPFYSPMFIRGASKEAIYNLSMVCLENAKHILLALEKEFKEIFERNLTVKRLGEVLLSPRLPYLGDNIYYDLNKEASGFMDVSIESLLKLERIIK
ncbi:MAG: cytidyltransferase [Tissierellia bacterium]|nr:cytidyltransferase [Tissierellia bacterium]